MTNVVETSAENGSPKKIPISWGVVGMVFTAFAFVVLVSMLYLSYNRLIRMHAHLANFVTQLNNKVILDTNELAAVQQSLQQSHDALATQQQVMNELRGTQKNSKEEWNVLEAQYLVKLANDNLQIGDNISLVISLLQTADQKISGISDPKLLLVRKALAADIVSLQNVPQVDVTGIYLRLSALNDQVDKLPLPNKRAVSTDQNSVTPVSSNLPWWKRGLQQSWDVLRQIVVVRHHLPGAPPFIPPELQDFLYQNLHAELMQAMSAVVHKQPEIYRKSLQQASSWVSQYFLQDSPVTQEMLRNLNQLQTVTLHPMLPTLSASLQAFRDYSPEEKVQANSKSD